MKRRPLGDTGINTTPVSFGAMQIQANESGVSEELLLALENGVNFIDTARNYGDSERIVGATLREWGGERPFIASKIKPLDITNWRFYVPIERQFTPESIKQSVEDSLRILDAEYLDLVQLHQWYFLWGHTDEWLETFHSLKNEGKVRSIGVSAQDHEHDALLQQIDNQAVDAVQLLLNIFESRPFVSAIPLAEQRKVGVIGRCVFDHSGSLATGGNREVLARDVKLSNASQEIVTEYIRRIDRIIEEFCSDERDLAELSIRFALSRPGVSTLAVSMADANQVNTAIKAAEKGPLPEKDFQRLCRDHVWVKNFYYFSKKTVDGK
jgi:aryl-alcohol dehydrogenase-like predicted oxidoreductase